MARSLNEKSQEINKYLKEIENLKIMHSQELYILKKREKKQWGSFCFFVQEIILPPKFQIPRIYLINLQFPFTQLASACELLQSCAAAKSVTLLYYY